MDPTIGDTQKLFHIWGEIVYVVPFWQDTPPLDRELREIILGGLGASWVVGGIKVPQTIRWHG